jgi:hypothetical protein
MPSEKTDDVSLTYTPNILLDDSNSASNFLELGYRLKGRDSKPYLTLEDIQSLDLAKRLNELDVPAENEFQCINFTYDIVRDVIVLEFDQDYTDRCSPYDILYELNEIYVDILEFYI